MQLAKTSGELRNGVGDIRCSMSCRRENSQANHKIGQFDITSLHKLLSQSVTTSRAPGQIRNPIACSWIGKSLLTGLKRESLTHNMHKSFVKGNHAFLVNYTQHHHHPIIKLEITYRAHIHNSFSCCTIP